VSVSPATSDSRVSKNTREPFSDDPAKLASKLPLPPVDPIDSNVVVPPARSYTSMNASVSPATRDSLVWNTTRDPSPEAASKVAGNVPLPPVVPVDTKVVVAPVRWYTSRLVSVSAATSGSEVWKNALVPLSEDPRKVASKAPFPPAGPVETSVVVPPERS
jgi:hypothetical protein